VRCVGGRWAHVWGSCAVGPADGSCRWIGIQKASDGRNALALLHSAGETWISFFQTGNPTLKKADSIYEKLMDWMIAIITINIHWCTVNELQYHNKPKADEQRSTLRPNYWVYSIYTDMFVSCFNLFPKTTDWRGLYLLRFHIEVRLKNDFIKLPSG